MSRGLGKIERGVLDVLAQGWTTDALDQGWTTDALARVIYEPTEVEVRAVRRAIRGLRRKGLLTGQPPEMRLVETDEAEDGGEA